MSKRLGLTFFGVLVASMICYLAYASKGFNETLNGYMFGYLDNFQKYLFLITIFIVPFFIFLQRPINEPAIRIRLKDNIFYYILTRGLITSAGLSVFIYSAFLLWGIVFGLEAEFSLRLISLIFKLFLFIFACYVLSCSAYFISNRIVFGILSVMILNFVILIITLNVNYFLMNNLMPESAMMIAFYIYLFVIISGGLIYLYKGAKTKECLPSKNS